MHQIEGAGHDHDVEMAVAGGGLLEEHVRKRGVVLDVHYCAFS